jgi:hypothetical protein
MQMNEDECRFNAGRGGLSRIALLAYLRSSACICVEKLSVQPFRDGNRLLELSY